MIFVQNKETLFDLNTKLMGYVYIYITLIYRNKYFKSRTNCFAWRITSKKYSVGTKAIHGDDINSKSDYSNSKVRRHKDACVGTSTDCLMYCIWGHPSGVWVVKLIPQCCYMPHKALILILTDEMGSRLKPVWCWREGWICSTMSVGLVFM